LNSWCSRFPNIWHFAPNLLFIRRLWRRTFDPQRRFPLLRRCLPSLCEPPPIPLIPNFQSLAFPPPNQCLRRRNGRRIQPRPPLRTPPRTHAPASPAPPPHLAPGRPRPRRRQRRRDERRVRSPSPVPIGIGSHALGARARGAAPHTRPAAQLPKRQRRALHSGAGAAGWGVHGEAPTRGGRAWIIPRSGLFAMWLAFLDACCILLLCRGVDAGVVW
jgi:hypothetical protein